MTAPKSKRLVDLMWPKLPLRHQVPAILCLALGISVTAFLYVTVSGWENQRIQSEFSRDSDLSLASLVREIVQYEKLFAANAQLLHTLQAQNIGEFDQHFREFAERAFRRNPALDQVMYAARLEDGSLMELAYARTGDGPECVSVRETGVDPALLAAARTGDRLLSSDPFLPVDSDQAGYRIHVVTPVVSADPYRDELFNGHPPEAYLCARVRLNEFVHAALLADGDTELDYVLADVTSPGGSYFLDVKRWIEGTRGDAAIQGRLEKLETGFHQSSKVAFAGHLWRITTAPTGAYLNRQKTAWSWWVVVGGLMLSIVLADYFLILVVRLATFETMVREHVAALREADHQLAREQVLHNETARQLSRLHEAIDDCPTAIIITDANGQVEYVNYRVIEMTGCSRDELTGKVPPFFEDDRLPESLALELQKAMRAGREWWGEYRDRNANGETTYLELKASPIRNDAGESTHHVIMIADISERKRLQEQFLQSQKMEVIGRLAGGVVHDLSNMLTVILGFSQIVHGQLEDESPIRNDVEEIIRVTEKAGELNRQLLAFARTRAHQTETVDPNKILEDMNKFLGRTLGEDITLQISPGKNIGSIEIDPSQLNQLIMNLAVNARDAMPNGGNLIVKTRRSDLPANLCRVHRLPPGDYVMLSVRDTGFGMSEEVRSRLFEPFFTTKAEGEGTGLGLSTVYGIMKRFNGAIEVDSEPGKGTEFRAYFPLSTLTPEQAADEIKADVPGGNETIMVVEDDSDLRHLCTALLTGLGYQVLEATCGKQGLETFQRRSTDIDLVLTDIVMPDINGVDLARRMKLIQPEIRYMYTTGFSEHAALNRMDGYNGGLLRKPFTRAKLGHAVREALDAVEPTIDMNAGVTPVR